MTAAGVQCSQCIEKAFRQRKIILGGMYMARKRSMTVLDFASQIGAASVSIPVKIKRGFDVIGHATSLYALPVTGAPGLLESKITFVTLGRDEVIIQVK